MNCHVFGIVQPLPLRDFPEGKARIRLRSDAFAMVYIRTPNGGIRQFTVLQDSTNTRWFPGFEQGANIRTSTAKPQQDSKP